MTMCTYIILQSCRIHHSRLPAEIYLCILECLVKPPTDLHTKPHVVQVCSGGHGDKTCKLLDYILVHATIYSFTKPELERRIRLHTLQYKYNFCWPSAAVLGMTLN